MKGLIMSKWQMTAKILLCTAMGFAISSIAIATNDTPDIAMKAFELRMQGKAGEALKLLESSVEKNPKDARVQFELARVYFYTMFDDSRDDIDLKIRVKEMGKKLGLSQKAIEKAIKLEKNNPRYYYWAGKIGTYKAVYNSHSILKMPGLPFETIKSIRNYEKALKLNGDFHQARVELIGMYERLPWYCGGSKRKSKKHQAELEKRGAADEMDQEYPADPKERIEAIADLHVAP